MDHVGRVLVAILAVLMVLNQGLFVFFLFHHKTLPHDRRFYILHGAFMCHVLKHSKCRHGSCESAQDRDLATLCKLEFRVVDQLIVHECDDGGDRARCFVRSEYAINYLN